MTGFSTEKVKTESADGHHFVVIEAFSYVTKSGDTITVPVGTETDGASTPHALWPTLPPFGRYWKAAILHDFLYRYSKQPKTYCDQILLEAMESIGVVSAEAHLIYDGVFLGGRSSFDEDRKQSEALNG